VQGATFSMDGYIKKGIEKKRISHQNEKLIGFDNLGKNKRFTKDNILGSLNIFSCFFR